jgi:hypothetical protein
MICDEIVVYYFELYPVFWGSLSGEAAQNMHIIKKTK